MNSSQEISNISDISFHLSKQPPEMVKSLWPSETFSKNPKAFIDLSYAQENEAVSKGMNSPRKKKYSISNKRKSKKNTIILESIVEKSNIPSQDIFKKILSMLTFKAKYSISTVTKEIKKRRFVKDIQNLTPYHYDLIKDPCTVYPEMKKIREGLCYSYCKLSEIFKFLTNFRVMIAMFNFLQELYYFIIVLLTKVLLFFQKKTTHISPNSRFKVLWDFLIIILAIIQLFTFSIEKCFLVEFENNTFESGILFAFYIDLVITMNTKFFKDGVAVTDRIKIIKHMFSKKGFSDLLPCFCLSLVIYLKSEACDYLNLLLYIKIMKAKKLSKRVKELMIRTRQSDAIYQLAMLIIRIFLWAHLIAVLWHFVGYKSMLMNPESDNWLKSRGISNKDWQTKYLFSIYWGVTTMLTVGYGDISPKNNNEMIYNIVAMFIGCGIFGYSMNKIGEILNQYQSKKNYMNEQISKVNFMLRDKKLPHETQTKIKRYLEFVWKQEQKEDPEYEQFVMNKLSNDLKSEIFLHTNVRHLRQVPAFKAFSEKTLIMLARCMRKVCFSPEQFVYKEGESENLNIYFVLDGNLKSVSARDEKIMSIWKEFKQDDYFGEREIFTGLSRSLGIVSLDFSTLFKLSRSDIIQILIKTPNEYERFCEIRDLEILYNKFYQYEQPCFSCGFKDHPLEKCPYFCINPNQNAILYKHIKNQKEKAKKFKRKPSISHHALKQKFTSSTAQVEFLSLYDDDDELKDLFNLYTLEEDNNRPAIAGKDNETNEILPERAAFDDISSPSYKKESFIRQKSRELTLSRWRRKSVRGLSRPIIDKQNPEENELIKQRISQEECSSFIEKEINLNSPGSSANELKDESDDDINKIKHEKNKFGDKSFVQYGLQRKKIPTLQDLIKEDQGDIRKTKIIPLPPQDPAKHPITNTAKEKNQEPKAQSDSNSIYHRFESVRVFLNYFPHNNITDLIKKPRSHKSVY